jgi:acid stress-induced BolA-like protein IbaG/YrbA
VVSAAFDGKSRVQRHQLVYQTLGDRMRAEIHALSMKTFTPQEWQSQK